MIRILGRRKVCSVTRETIRRDSCEPGILMTGITVDGKMCTDKLKVCLLMIEDRRHPAIEGMARRAIVGELSAKMVRHSYPFKVVPVAGEAIGRCPGKFQRRMAQFACCDRMSAVERKNCSGVIELQGIFQLRP